MAILAIDQGQTKTVVVVVSEDGTILGTGRADGASAYYHGVAQSVGKIYEAALEAVRSSCISLEDLKHICGGIAGANWPEEISALENALRERFGARDTIVVNDAVIALRAGTDSPDAFVICNGSGMNCAVSVSGKLEMVYNNYVDQLDQGSEGIGARALKAVFNAHLGCGAETPMAQRFLTFYERQDIDQLMLSFYKGKLSKPLKDAAEIVFEQAAANDPVALECIYSYGKSIARYATGAVDKYHIAPEHFVVVLSGGVFKNPNPLLYETVCSQIHRKYPKIPICQSHFEPVIGAALYMLDQLGDRDDAAHQNCRSEAEQRQLVREICEMSAEEHR